MNNENVNNIKKYRLAAGMKQVELCKIVGITQGALSGWENGKYEPDIKSLNKMAELFNTTIDELMGYAPETEDLPFRIYPITRKRFRMLGAIACGEPRYADEDHETYIEASADIQADFCLTAKGDSMIGARIMDGDIVFIREQPMVEDGEIAAVIIDDEATLKRVKYNKEKQQLTLFPANDKYDPLVFIGEELNQIRILGKAVCFMSNL